MKSFWLLISIVLSAVPAALSAEPDTLAVYEAEAILTTSGGVFAPYYMSSNRHGMISSGDNALLSVKAERKMNQASRFSWGGGVQVAGGYSSKVNYSKYDASSKEWTANAMRPAALFLQQLYASVKWRSLFLSAGMRERGSALVDNRLSSGDLVYSGNARPIPECRIGFIDNQPVPFTKGFLKVSGEFAYGKFTDSDWWSRHGDSYNSMTMSGLWYVYRRLYFKSDISASFSLTIGAQAAGQFGGRTEYMYRGELRDVDPRGVKFADFFKMIVPFEKGKEGFLMGNTLGTWDIKGSWRLKNGMELDGYVQMPWEDGSGIAKLNGFDGLYGVRFSMPGDAPVLSGAVVEYLDLANQSGPMHWAPADSPGTLITTEATGADDYYNNKFYGPYANYGMLIGNPMVMAPIYNLDGYNTIIANRMRGFHVAAEGYASASMRWQARFCYRKAYGNGFEPLIPARHSTSASVAVDWSALKSKQGGLEVGTELAIDRGSLPGNSFGAMVKVSYSGILSLRK